MLHRVLADLVLVVHLGFIVFVVLGGLLALRWRWAPALHLPAVLWGGFIELSGGICPLTPLENLLRRSAGASGYSGSFIEHYLLPTLYPSGLTREAQLGLAALVVVVNVIVYVGVGRRRRRTRAGLAS